MKKTLWVFLLAACIAFASLAFTAQADTVPQFTVAASGADYTGIESALAAMETMADSGQLNESGVKLVLTGTHTATVRDGILFGQKTIFLPSGKKLPITVCGGTLNLPAGSVACTNDYTFTDIVIPFDDVQTKLFAGTGNVVLGNITMDLNGTAGEYKGRFYGDNFTAKAFDGWSEENLALYTENGLFTTSMTLCHGFVYQNTSAFPYAAVGSATDFSAAVGTKTVSADDTCAKLVIDGAKLQNTMARTDISPVANSVLEIKSGEINHLYAGGFSLTSAIQGDVTVIVDGANARLNHFPRLLSKVSLNGDLSVTFKNLDLTENTGENGKMIQLAFNGVSVAGDISVWMENVKADRFYGAFSNGGKTVNGNVSFTAKNCEFSKFFYGGFGSASIVGNVENTLENVRLGLYRGLDECLSLTGNLTTNWKNVTLGEQSSSQNVYLGSAGGSATRIKGNLVNVLEDVTVPNPVTLFLGSYHGTLDGNLTSTVKSGTYGHYVYGANCNGTVNGTVTNNIQGGTYEQEVYLAGYYADIQGQVVNNVSGGDFHKLYLFCGTRAGKISNTALDYAVKNSFSGGYFKGVWGGSGGGSAKHYGNIYNEITGGTFDTYSKDSSKLNSFAGGPRNTLHIGNVKTLIRGGVFHGWVAGGTIPNSADQSQTSQGNTELILAGGDFQGNIVPDCRWGTYTGTTVLNINTETAVEPLLITVDAECSDLIAASDHYPLALATNITAKNIIARGKSPLILNGKVCAKSFTVEEGTAAPTVYGVLSVGTLNAHGNALHVGAKARITADAVNGTVTLHQTELWTVNTYFASPADTEIELSQAEDAFGKVEVKNGVVKGLSDSMAGVAFIFSDNVSLRFAFDKEWAEGVKDGFSFTAKAGTQTIVNGATFDDLVLKDGYYTVVSAPIETENYNEAITYSGNYLPANQFKMTTLAATGVKIYDKAGQYQELGNLLKAFANYAVATHNYKNKTSDALPYANLATPTDFAVLQEGMNSTDASRGIGYMPLTSTAHVELTGRQFILDDGMRVRYILKGQQLYSYNQSSAKVHSLHFWYGCKNITDTVTKTWVKDSTFKGHYEITVDIPLYPSTIGNYVRFLVTEQSTLNNNTSYVIDHVDRLDALAEELSKTSGGEELGCALQYYVQASQAYYPTQPDAESFVYPTAFSAGHASADVSPYGFRMQMYSYAKGHIVMDPIRITCLSLWDGEDLALYYSMDIRQCDDTFTKTYKAFLSQTFGVHPDKIFFNATHNHSSPDAGSRSKENVPRWYSEIFEPSLVRVTKLAIADLAPAEVYAGKAISAPGTNYVRRYVRQDGSFTGIHVYETDTSSPVVGYESEADKELRTLRFDRGDKKDIVFVNWQGHAAHGANQYSTQFTADFVGFLRDGVQNEMNALFVYCNGASGNLNFTPKTTEDRNAKYFTGNYFDGVGKSLVGTVKEAVAAEEKVNTGKFQVNHIEYMAPVKVDPDDLREKALTVNEACKAYAEEIGGWKSVTQQRTYIFNNFAGEAPFLQSTYHLSSIITRNNYKTAGTTELLIDVYAFSFGDVAMGFVPYEQFDTNGKQIRDGVADLYKMTFSGGYTNGTKSYVPSNLASIDNQAAKKHYGGYEVYTCRYADGTGDGVSAAIVKALREMKN